MEYTWINNQNDNNYWSYQLDQLDEFNYHFTDHYKILIEN
jgi:hypothetical protein